MTTVTRDLGIPVNGVAGERRPLYDAERTSYQRVWITPSQVGGNRRLMHLPTGVLRVDAGSAPSSPVLRLSGSVAGGGLVATTSLATTCANRRPTTIIST